MHIAVLTPVFGSLSAVLAFDAAPDEAADAGEVDRSDCDVVHPDVEPARWRVLVHAAMGERLPLDDLGA
ncbi:hypothetical protein ABZ783_30480 [Micromonospora sp. NPDC047738]|uniref:hypothetical protein n=1 Tax=Micromonospora sp. NPDC047738 TaxID=3155741 RepID=UPI0033D112FB